jgi:hypothetical protein
MHSKRGPGTAPGVPPELTPPVFVAPPVAVAPPRAVAPPLAVASPPEAARPAAAAPPLLAPDSPGAAPPVASSAAPPVADGESESASPHATKEATESRHAADISWILIGLVPNTARHVPPASCSNSGLFSATRHLVPAQAGTVPGNRDRSNSPKRGVIESRSPEVRELHDARHAEAPGLSVDARGWRAVGECLCLRQREFGGRHGAEHGRCLHRVDRWRTDRRCPGTDGGYGCERRFGANGWRPRCQRINGEWRRLADGRRDGNRRSREHGWRNSERRHSGNGRRDGNRRSRRPRRQRRRDITRRVPRNPTDRRRAVQRPPTLLLRRLPQR